MTANGSGLLAAVREPCRHPTIPPSLACRVVMVLSVNRRPSATMRSDWLMHGCFSLYCNHLEVPPAPSSCADHHAPTHPQFGGRLTTTPPVTRLP